MSAPTSLSTPTDDGYELCQSGDILKYGLPDLNVEHPLDKAMRCDDISLRCYYEEHGYQDTMNHYNTLSSDEKGTYYRLPRVAAAGIPAGAFYVRTYDGRYQEITADDAAEHPMYAFVAA